MFMESGLLKSTHRKSGLSFTILFLDYQEYKIVTFYKKVTYFFYNFAFFIV